MVYGPCGGVGPNGGCEVDDRPCPFVADPVVAWRGAPMSPRPLELPHLIVDIRPDLDDPHFAASVDILREAGVVGLIGDHVDDPVGAPIHDVVRTVVERGLSVIATVACRNRTEDDCRAAVVERMAAGACLVLCVTGDHPAARFAPSSTAAFGLDGVRLAAVARSLGASVAVAESPASPPTAERAARLLGKQHAGADLGVLNHGGDEEHLIDFADRARHLGVSMPLVAPVPVITDHGALQALTQFPGVSLPSALVRHISSAAEPRQAGVDAAVAFGCRLLTTGRFGHLNLSGRASSGDSIERSRIMSEVAAGIADHLGSPRPNADGQRFRRMP